jgi:outer membrane protein assembly factor BamB
MKKIALKVTVLAVLAALAACGGGSSGGGNNGGGITLPEVKPPVLPPYEITPAVLTATAVAGYSETINLVAKQSVPFVGVAYLKVVPDADVINPEIPVTVKADGTFGVAVKTSAAIKAGSYTGNITINVCNDPACGSHLAGSPFKLPYSITVVPPEGAVTAQNLSQLSALTGAPDWGTFQGNAQHTGYVPVTLAPSAFNARWKMSAMAVNGRILQFNPIATGGGQVYISTGNYFTDGGRQLAAYKESDGSMVWVKTFDHLAYPSTNAPAYAGNKVYMSAGQQSTTGMYAFDATTGAQLFRWAMSSQWETYFAPTVFNGSVYTNGGGYGGMYSFNTGSGVMNYFVALPQMDRWTPAVAASGLYVSFGGRLQARDPATGAERFSMEGVSSGSGRAAVPIIGEDGLVFAGSTAFNVNTRTVAWSSDSALAGNQAYSNRTLFGANSKTGELEARSDSTGALLWKWPAPVADGPFTGDVLVTNNLVFVSTASKTYAIDRTTHVPAWSYPLGGALAVSANGVLYIKAGGILQAINLK